jgi:hypothetical protein
MHGISSSTENSLSAALEIYETYNAEVFLSYKAQPVGKKASSANGNLDTAESALWP